MATAYPPDLAALYEVDETAWLDAMADLAGSGRLDLLDATNLAEFLRSMADRERREVRSRLIVLLAHLLKCAHQPEKRTRSWNKTILTQRRQLDGLLESATLRRHAAEILGKTYRKAVLEAALETGLSAATFPAECPFTLETALGGPIEPDPA